ncbi:hypothetical protein D3C86_1874470 [compost metagenome]
MYKRLNKNKKNALVLESDNRFYPNYEVKASDILEIWEYECNIGRSDRRHEQTESQSMKDLLLEVKREVMEIKNNTSGTN